VSQSGSAAQPSQDQLAADLYNTAVAAAATHNRTFKPIAAGIILTTAREAAAEVLSPQRFGLRSTQEATYSLSERTDHARSAMRALVDAMNAHASTIQGYEADLLGERTYTNALKLSGFCPCWPIC